jgi:hypothetical protein
MLGPYVIFRGAWTLPRLFISHSSQNDDWALALRDWPVREGWRVKDDIVVDLDPDRGIVAGQRWAMRPFCPGNDGLQWN